MLPVLAQRVCILSGTALTMPITVVIVFKKNKKLRPQSDTVKMTDLWK